jgi:nucleoside 2-deoxyribosyltransferase
MPRSLRYLTIEGQYAAGVLGQFRLIRGFATLQDLALISTPYEMAVPDQPGAGVIGHQRRIDEQHAADIQRYLQAGSNRFIPEIILSIRSTWSDLELADRPGEFVGVENSGTDGLTVRRRYASRSMRIHQITVDLQRLEHLHQARVIRRIDGNHRLHHAAELAGEETSPNKYLAPFCAILLEQPEDANDDFTEAMLFHVINSTAKHLDSEHALRLVLGQNAQFFPAEEEFRTSPALHLTRLLKQGVEGLPEALRNRLGLAPLSVLHDAAQALVESVAGLTDDRAKLATFADSFNGALTELLSNLRGEYPQLCQADFFVELAALVWRNTNAAHSHDERVSGAATTLSGIGRWLGENGLDGLDRESSMAAQLLTVYQAVQDRIPKRIFLARWYPGDNDGHEQEKARLRLEMINRTLADIAAEDPPIQLELVDMGTQEGGTFPIHSEMYQQIRQADIVLVDLSGVRPNVCIEAGYALDRHTKNRLLFLFQESSETTTNRAHSDPPFDLDTFRYEKITDAAAIPDKLKPHLRQIWLQAQVGR